MVHKIKTRLQAIEPENKAMIESNQNFEGHIVFYWRKDLFQLWGKS
ncbi:MAG: hypothetical protein ACFFD7_08560 [Candidatus Thorarchaeota archaeon]